ncbi:MAG: hypothetical protein RhofKO_08760 [Rhodothermales bacterium]
MAVILILTNKWDITADFVVEDLRDRKVKFLRVNSEDLVEKSFTISFPDFKVFLKVGREQVNITDCLTAVWYRRPGFPYDNVHESIKPSKAVQKFINSQWLTALEALQLIPHVLWINDPVENTKMENKARQLLRAQELGFNIPQTSITNDSEEVQRLARLYENRVVAKALYAPLVEEEEQDYFIFSNVVSLKQLDSDEIALSPAIFQQPIQPKIDYRVTVIADKVIPVRISLPDKTTSKLDWRTDEKVIFEPCSLPVEIENLCRQYVKRSNLVFGAIDLVEQNGEFYFLEINPNGEWGWLQKIGSVSIASEVANVLCR